MVSHYDGFAPGIAGKSDSMLVPAFSLLIKQGTACAASAAALSVAFRRKRHPPSKKARPTNRKKATPPGVAYSFL